jgi:hypothetical protein
MVCDIEQKTRSRRRLASSAGEFCVSFPLAASTMTLHAVLEGRGWIRGQHVVEGA